MYTALMALINGETTDDQTTLAPGINQAGAPAVTPDTVTMILIGPC